MPNAIDTLRERTTCSWEHDPPSAECVYCPAFTPYREALERVEVLLQAAEQWEGAYPEHLCACGHSHIAGEDGEDLGCRTCECMEWKESPTRAALAAAVRRVKGET